MGRRIASANPYNLRPGEDSPYPDLSGQNAHIDNRDQGFAALAPKLALGAVGSIATAGLAPLIFGAGGAASAAPAAASSTAAGGSGMGFSLGKLLGSRGFEAAANGLTSLFGMRAQNKANRYATDANARLQADQIAMERDRIRRQDEVDALDRADATKRWEAEQAMRAQEYAAAQEERAYARSLSEDREARRAAYRPMQDAAMRSLGSLLRVR